MTQTGDETPMHVLFADLATTLETRWGRHYDKAFEAGYRQGSEESFLAGVEAAAKFINGLADKFIGVPHGEHSEQQYRDLADAIRSLKPPKGGDET